MKMRTAAALCSLALGLSACEHMGELGRTMERNPEAAGALVCGALTGDLAPTAICAALGAGGGYLYRRSVDGRATEGCRSGDVPVSRRDSDGVVRTYCVPRSDVDKARR
jgi:hypothetical protein